MIAYEWPMRGLFIHSIIMGLGLASAAIADEPFTVIPFATGLENPWGMEFLPDGRALVTERPGRLRIVDKQGKLSEPIQQVPAVFAEGQGGLLDVILAPDFKQSRMIYLSYAEPGKDKKAGTAVARAKLVDDRLEDLTVIFRQEPKVEGNNHFGSRLAFASDEHLFITLGERFDYSENSQTLDNHLGKVIRLNADGSVPKDNPFVNQKGALPEIWSYGHRNSQGAAVHPQTGKLWMHEHGARGGDEINISQAGKNYGWPKASYGSHYSFLPIPDDHKGQGFMDPIHYWTPSIAPSGMLFYTGKAFPEWQGDLFVGALAETHLAHLELDGERVVKENKLLVNQEKRIRDVEQGPDGAIYLLVDDEEGEILTLRPKP
jgi:glucose/arabinose dehydrogenase